MFWLTEPGYTPFSFLHRTPYTTSDTAVWLDRMGVVEDDDDAVSVLFENEFFAWREWKIDIKRLKNRRKFVTSFGSCSFDEPREDLRALNLLWLGTLRCDILDAAARRPYLGA
jgi:hypothetical protein